jgi:hypothetical protein
MGSASGVEMISARLGLLTLLRLAAEAQSRSARF